MAKVCDCFPELKEITEAREGRYRTHPEKEAPEGPQSFVEVKVTSIGQLNELVECKKSGYKFLISEPAHVGGQNCAPTPLEFLLSGAIGCYAAVFACYAAKLGVASADGFSPCACAVDPFVWCGRTPATAARSCSRPSGARRP